jgi:two-component system C4-dicarboxylate transport response regulator DctD
MTSPSILVVDDDPANIRRMEQALAPTGFAVVAAAHGVEALDRLDDLSGPIGFDGIVVSDLKMPVMDGRTLLSRIRRLDPDLPLILVTSYGDVATAVEAIKAGAYDFIERPLDLDVMAAKVTRAIDKRRLVLENRRLKADLAAQSGIDTRLIGRAPALQALREEILSIAATDVTVLIHGDTGTGKEVVARALHALSPRAKGRFVPINCGALTETVIESELFGHEPGAFTDAKQRRIGLAEHAKGGTLFFDEVESMPMKLQVKLLRMLQERVIVRLGSNTEIPVDIRVVAATKADLLDAAGRGEFREDLYFRLGVAELHIPRLNDRREDIPLLFAHFVEEFERRYECPARAVGQDDLQRLLAHNWRGNVRELRNAAERFVLGLGPRPDPAAAADGRPVRGKSLPEQVDALEAMLIGSALAEHGGRVQDTAAALGVPRRTLYEKMRKFGLERPAKDEG